MHSSAGPPASDEIPLCVDLDGTLTRTDVFVDALAGLLLRSPWLLARVSLWLLRGRARLKHEVLRRCPVDAAHLPWRDEVLAWVNAQAESGRAIYLTTGTDEGAALRVAAFAGCFTGVLASDGRINLVGACKARALRDRFGARGFDYAGNSPKDLAVWREAGRAMVVGSASLARRAAAVAPVAMHWPAPETAPTRRLAALVAALRPHHWIKNLLVAVPLVAAHRAAEPTLLRHTTLAFIAFSLVASAAYVLNDLADLDGDRRHPRKRHRPFASGRLPASAGAVLAPLLVAGGAALAMALPRAFGGWLLAYFAVTLAYTIRLKALAGIDVLVLAGLYALRVVAGAAATGIVLSGWLVAFSAFMFLSLALVKREVELHAVRRAGSDRAFGRAYRLVHLRFVRVAGWLAGIGAVGVLAGYVVRSDVTALYRRPAWLWVGCAVVAAWLAHIWRRAAHGHVHDDPVVFALRDRFSRVAIIALVLVFIAAT
ncbi:MAG: UbiA family prenyltransferase [Casimicrobiaceae bacterium]